MKNRSKLTLLLALALGLSACTGAKAPEQKDAKVEQKKKAEEIVYGITTSPEGKFNPLFSNTQYDGNVNKLVYDSLLKLNADIKVEPSLAKEYKLSEDGKKITFVLKDNLKFHDGKPLTSKDIKFTLTALASPDYEGDLGSYVQSITGFKDYKEGKEKELKGIVTPDDKTIEIMFDVPYSPVLINIGTLSILPEHIWGEIAVKDWTKNENMAKPIGTGPYKFDEFKPGEFVKLSANADYHNGAPNLKKFVFKVVNEETVTAELLKGSVDIVDMSSISKDNAKTLKDGKVEVLKYPNSKIQYMGFNLRNETLKDKNLRTAIAYGIDREGIVNGLLEGNGVVINTPMVPTLWSYPKEGLVEYKMDEAKAKDLLKQAGYTDTNGNGTVDKDGKELELSLVVPTGDKIREKTGTIIQDNLSKIGVKVKLEPMEFKAVMGKVVGDHDFEMYLMGNTLEADPDPTPNWYSTQASDEKGVFGWNIAGFRSPEADKLMNANRSAVNQEERAKVLNEFGKLLNKELPWVPLYVSDIVKAYNSGLKNYKANTFVDFYNVEKWELEK